MIAPIIPRLTKQKTLKATEDKFRRAIQSSFVKSGVEMLYVNAPMQKNANFHVPFLSGAFWLIVITNVSSLCQEWQSTFVQWY